VCILAKLDKFRLQSIDAHGHSLGDSGRVGIQRTINAPRRLLRRRQKRESLS
jgi:hypothetical protein